MNRYQQEVADADRRYQLLVRTLSLAGAAVLFAIALWSAGVSPTQWWATAQRWWSHADAGKEFAGSIPIPQPLAVDAPTVSAASATRGSAAADSSITLRPGQLYLVATVPGSNKHEGMARIGTSRENPQTYSAGALLVNGARIAEIHRDHVLLEREGERVDLYLHTLAAQAGRPADPLIMVSDAVLTRPPPPMTREVLTDYLRPSPVFKDETLHGYQVYPGRKAGVFSQLGLRSGDVITAINDAPVLETSGAIEALKEITKGTSVVVSVERSGKSERLLLDGTLITSDLEQDKDSVGTRRSVDGVGA
jgi:type II secretion system protein C